MKSLKILLTFTFLTLSTTHFNAQNFYVIGGVNFSKLYESKTFGQYIKSRTVKPGFQIGAAYDYEFSTHFSVMPQIQLSLKREHQRIEQELSGPDIYDNLLIDNAELNEYYIDIPVNLKYTFFMQDVNISLLAGPYFNYLLGNNTYSSKYGGKEFEDLFTNRIDYGFNLGFGLEYSSFLIYVTTDFGLYRDLDFEYYNSDGKSKNTVLKVSFGYKL
ncbi:outer membrane beta-barrel protein [Formosa sp. A9]|uniref:outer membrane beta-barrel protein n=1 Tax=Formosa sp. A9 TaxID=3442641 RepID=UPI003EBB0D91